MQARIRISWKQISAELLKPGTSQDNLDTSAMLALGVPLCSQLVGDERVTSGRAGRSVRVRWQRGAALAVQAQ